MKECDPADLVLVLRSLLAHQAPCIACQTHHQLVDVSVTYLSWNRSGLFDCMRKTSSSSSMESSSCAICPRTARRFSAASSLTASPRASSASICCWVRQGCLFLSKMSPGCAVEFVFRVRTAMQCGFNSKMWEGWCGPGVRFASVYGHVSLIEKAFGITKACHPKFRCTYKIMKEFLIASGAAIIQYIRLVSHKAIVKLRKRKGHASTHPEWQAIALNIHLLTFAPLFIDSCSVPVDPKLEKCLFSYLEQQLNVHLKRCTIFKLMFLAC